MKLNDKVDFLAMQFGDYFVSVYENTLLELVIFTIGALLIFIGAHIYKNSIIRKNRSSIPLVVGGWGTRGKSGTERLKAAIMNALGYSVVSKATGCEATIMLSPTFLPLREMLLFRPYDNATIWEQYDVLEIAAKFNCQVLLWECMGLEPRYVDLLQKVWMRDDFSTITNTFPDHEDIQGPTGIDISKAISKFIPENSKIFTTEEEMFPILQQEAKRLNTETNVVSWIDDALVMPEILDRFQYKEHPNNVALVLAMAKELGLNEDFALKEMADRVIFDVGALITFAIAKVRYRRLELTNGMSANEKLSCLNNWYRLGFEKYSIEHHPDVWISVIVNNRADRISRSKIFANILINHISVDTYFLVGTNLTGFMGYIEDDWQYYIQNVSLWNPNYTPGEFFLSCCKKFKFPVLGDMVIERFRTMLREVNVGFALEDILKLWNNPDKVLDELNKLNAPCAVEIVYQLTIDLEAHEQCIAFLKAILESKTDEKDKLDNEFRKLVGNLFFKKFVVIEDPKISGEKLIYEISNSLPPGFYHRIMGIQNIKGVGLELLYRWQIWDNCHRLYPLLNSYDSAVVEQGLKTLATFTDFTLLCEDSLKQTLEELRNRPIAQDEVKQALIQLIFNKLNESLEGYKAKFTTIEKVSWIEKIVTFLETFFDPGYAIKRRKTAIQVYKDLVNQRISYARATQILQDLFNQQKGGYLYPKFQRFMKRFF